MPTTWTDVADVITSWEVDKAHRVGGFGDAWGFFSWGLHDDYNDFTKVEPIANTEWVKQ